MKKNEGEGLGTGTRDRGKGGAGTREDTGDRDLKASERMQGRGEKGQVAVN